MEEKFAMDFELWLVKQDYSHCVVSPSHVLMFSPTSMFHFQQLPFIMQFGVLQYFFEQNDIPVIVSKRFDDTFQFVITSTTPVFRHFGFKTSEEAKTEAIKKAKHIYNRT